MSLVTHPSLVAATLALAACATSTTEAPAESTAGSAAATAPATSTATTASRSAGSATPAIAAAGSAGSATPAVVIGSAAGSGSADQEIYGGLLGTLSGEMGGGLGGFGGSGWSGTPPGTGSASGLGRRTPSAAPVKLGKPTLNGDIDPEIIKRYIKRSSSKIEYCYARVLLDRPTLRGVVTAKFYIGGDGRVQASTATGVHPDVARCVAAVIKAIEFPKPKGSNVQATFPFTFAPAET